MDGFTVGGMAKGSGMIHPQLATMLAVVTTDYPLEPGEAIDFLRPAVDRSFNSISVDGECSTNDAVCLLANGASGIERTPASDTAFALALGRVCRRARRADRRRRRGRDRARRDRGHRRRRRGPGTCDRGPDRDLAARQDRALRARRELGPRARRSRLGAAQRRLRLGRRGPGDARLQRHDGARAGDAARRRAGRRQRRLPDRARPRPRRRRGELPHHRPLLRLRPHQRGLPHRDRLRSSLKVGRRGRRRGAAVAGARPRGGARGLRRARRRPADLGRAGAARAWTSRFVGGPARDERRGAAARPALAHGGQRRGLRRARAASRCRSSATRSGSTPRVSRSSASSARRSRARLLRSRTRSPPASSRSSRRSPSGR